MEIDGSLPHLQVSATCPYLEPDQSVHAPHPTSWRSILILSSLPLLGLPNGLFPSGVPTKALYASFLSPIRATCPVHPILPDLITWIIFVEEYRSLSSSWCSFFPLSCYLFPLRPKYSPQHRIVKHPQPTFLPQCERSIFTPIQNNRPKYRSVCLNLYIFR